MFGFIGSELNQPGAGKHKAGLSDFGRHRRTAGLPILARSSIELRETQFLHQPVFNSFRWRTVRHDVAQVRSQKC